MAFSYVGTRTNGRPDAGPWLWPVLWMLRASGEPWLWSISAGGDWPVPGGEPLDARPRPGRVTKPVRGSVLLRRRKGKTPKLPSSVRPAIGKLGRDQGARKI
jgi:hypothetical protein